MIPSRSFRKQVKQVFTEDDYGDSLVARRDYLTHVAKAINSPFGLALLRCMEGMEEANIAKLVELSPLRVLTAIRCRAEIKMARYIRMFIVGQMTDLEALERELEELNEQYARASEED